MLELIVAALTVEGDNCVPFAASWNALASAGYMLVIPNRPGDSHFQDHEGRFVRLTVDERGCSVLILPERKG